MKPENKLNYGNIWKAVKESDLKKIAEELELTPNQRRILELEQEVEDLKKINRVLLDNIGE